MTDLLADLQIERLKGLQSLSAKATDQIVKAILSATTIPKLRYHFQRHGNLLRVQSEVAYLRAFRRHLEREDLRIFTYLRPKDRSIFWEVVSIDNAATAVYNETAGAIWSFFMPSEGDRRMAQAQTWWVEVVRASDGWRFVRDWIWTQ